VDIYRLTSMHYVEKHLPQEIRQTLQASEKLYKIYPRDKWYIEAGEPKVKAWYKIQDMAYLNNSIKETFIGKSKCMFFKINDVVGLYEKELIRDPFGLYGMKMC
jgi:aminoglycoside 3-N-acetyltransferase